MAIKKCEKCEKYYGKRLKECLYCGEINNDIEIHKTSKIVYIIGSIILLALIFGIYKKVTYESEYDKENRYITELNTEFDSKFPNSLKETFLFKKNSTHNCNLSINYSKIICPIKISTDENGKEIFEIDHDFSQTLLSNGYNLSYDLDKVDYLIFTEYDLKEVGRYVDEDGKSSGGAYRTYNSLYIYDLKSNKLCFITSHQGSEPPKYIQTKHAVGVGTGDSWNSSDYFSHLIENNKLDKSKDFNYKVVNSKEYIEYLEKNNFLGLELKQR